MTRFAIILLLGLSTFAHAAVPKDSIPVGVAQIDITPDYPVRLNGFGFRRTESEGVTQKIWAKALAFTDKKEGPAILITVDNLGIADEITLEVASRLKKKIGLKRERLTVTATHTHTSPMLKGVSPTVFGVDIPPEHQANIDRYTREFTDKLEQVALAALKKVQPSRLSWGIGTAKFAVNRRNEGGPADHDLPTLVVKDLDGKVRAIYFSYACHCVTLSNNKISGDWAGYAQEAVQKQFPGAVVLASVGCGADANPSSGAVGDKIEICADQGQQIGNEVKRLLSAELTPITVKPTTRYARIDLPFDKPRTRAEWEARAKDGDYAVAYHARLNLSRLDRGEILPTQMTYPVQTWFFGEQLAMVFLPGETVVDYSVRLKREYDRKRLWVNGYANESRCYLPSERVLKEGGYEGGGAQIYYDRPQRFAPGVEQKVVDIVIGQIPKTFLAPKGTEGVRALSPGEALRAFRTKPGLEIELVASEPLITSPVAIDWGADGRLWVCEMFDYPAGLDGDYQPGGRVRFLEDTNHDGNYDKSTVFLENLPFPTGVTAWGRGVLICAAPDILYAEDTNGDGKADKVEKLYSGFPTENYQARVNSLSLGLDNWIYGANGLLSQTVTNSSTRVDIRNRDFRFHPGKGTFEAAGGWTQQGRVRDDWGQWFGCHAGAMVICFPHEERYSHRNPHVIAPNPSVAPMGDFDGDVVYPISKMLERFNDPEAANRATSACGIGIYRDTLLGSEYYGNTFTCEPVHNLVHRLVLDDSDHQLRCRRGEGEQSSEFLASTDNWFRPVQVCNGPDGALYIVDLYRFVIEHPRWIPAARLAQLDVRAGANRGRIYRITPAGKTLRPIPDLTKLSASKLAAALDSPNGTERDRVHGELLLRRDKTDVAALEKLAVKATLPQVRLQSLCVLDGVGKLKPALLQKAMSDSDPHVRQQAVRLCENFLSTAGFKNQKSEGRVPRVPDFPKSNETPDIAQLATTLLSLTKDSSHLVLRQLALTLGEWDDPRAGRALAELAANHLADADLRQAVLSSAVRHCGDILDKVTSMDEKAVGRVDWIPPLVATAVALDNDSLFQRALSAVLLRPNGKTFPGQFAALANLLEALERKKNTLAEYLASHPELRDVAPRLAATFASARRIATDPSAATNTREVAIRLLARGVVSNEEINLFCSLVTGAGSSEEIRAAALSALRRQRGNMVAAQLLAQWKQISPAIRTEIVGVLINRDEWARQLLSSIKEGVVRPMEIGLADRQRLTQKGSDETRRLAAEVFPAQPATGRAEVIQKYQAALSLSGNATKGADVFGKNCASCHLLGRTGHDVGPNLAALLNKDADYWLKNILDPNAIVEPRFINYEVVLKDDRTLSGVIKSETANNVTIMAGGGVTENIKRADIADIRASSLSLMPEGLEQGMTFQEVADLIAFLKSSGAAKPASNISADSLQRDPASLARLILDAKQSDAAREAAVSANPQFAADLIVEMTRDLKAGTPEEYARIPWIWRVAIASGKRNDPAEIKHIVTVSLPGVADGLHDWQAVVIGGGIINGLSQRNCWPAERLSQIFAGDEALLKNVNRSLELAASLAENENIPTGTRYDALRMLGVEPWEKRGTQLVRYLAKGTDEELQMGAVSALSDIKSSEATAALLAALPNLAGPNQEIALNALLRDDARIAALLDAVANGKIAKSLLGKTRIEKLLNYEKAPVRERAKGLLSALSK